MNGLNLLSPSPAMRLHDFAARRLDGFLQRAGDQFTVDHPAGKMASATWMIRLGIEAGMRFRLPPGGLLLEQGPGEYAPRVREMPSEVFVLDWTHDAPDFDGETVLPTESVLVVYSDFTGLMSAMKDSRPEVADIDVPTGVGPVAFVAHRFPTAFARKMAEDDGVHFDDIEWWIQPSSIQLTEDFRISMRLDEGSGEVLSTFSGIISKQLIGEFDPEAEIDGWNRPIHVLAQFLLASQCENVHAVSLPENTKLARSRVKRGKPALSYWHTLNVCLPSSSAKYVTHGGSHTSPRFHLRRGHIRRYKVGKTTWVRSCAVGKKELGSVVKDYMVGVNA